MGDFLTFFKVKDLNLVEVREYCGIDGNQYVWTFLGYDVVRTDESGKAVSVISDDNIEYDYLEKINLEDEKNKEKYSIKSYDIDYYNHDGLLEGDVRAKVVDIARERVLGKNMFVSLYDIKRNIDKNSTLYFLHQSNKECVKVKEKQK